MSRLAANGLLLLAALLFGLPYVAQKAGADLMDPFAFVAARFGIAALVIAPFALREQRASSTPARPPMLRLTVAICLALFLGASLQQIGLETTSVTNGGFLTACYVALTPFVVWALSRTRPRSVVLASSFVSLVGAWLLATGGGPATPPVIGDALILAADVAWAVGFALTPIYLGRGGRPLTLAFLQYAVCAVLAGVASFAFERPNPQTFIDAAQPLLITGVVSGAIAFTMQICAQKHTPPAEAALVLSTESLFAALGGAVFLGEEISELSMIGAALILAGAAAADGAPPILRFFGSRRRPSAV